MLIGRAISTRGVRVLDYRIGNVQNSAPETFAVICVSRITGPLQEQAVLLVHIIRYQSNAVYLGPAFLAPSAASPIFTEIFMKYGAFSLNVELASVWSGSTVAR